MNRLIEQICDELDKSMEKSIHAHEELQLYDYDQRHSSSTSSSIKEKKVQRKSSSSSRSRQCYGCLFVNLSHNVLLFYHLWSSDEEDYLEQSFFLLNQDDQDDQ
jgi:hypothetical protein